MELHPAPPSFQLWLRHCTWECNLAAVLLFHLVEVRKNYSNPPTDGLDDKMEWKEKTEKKVPIIRR
jgi:hypothetical protein